MPYPATARHYGGRPMSDLNITPLIDVMLVLLIMFILAIPIATHGLQVPLPNGAPTNPIEETNVVHIDASDRLFWNGAEMDRQGLLNQLVSLQRKRKSPLGFQGNQRAFQIFGASL